VQEADIQILSTWLPPGCCQRSCRTFRLVGSASDASTSAGRAHSAVACFCCPYHRRRVVRRVDVIVPLLHQGPGCYPSFRQPHAIGLSCAIPVQVNGTFGRAGTLSRNAKYCCSTPTTSPRPSPTSHISRLCAIGDAGSLTLLPANRAPCRDAHPTALTAQHTTDRRDWLLLLRLHRLDSLDLGSAQGSSAVHRSFPLHHRDHRACPLVRSPVCAHVLIGRADREPVTALLRHMPTLRRRTSLALSDDDKRLYLCAQPIASPATDVSNTFASEPSSG
jgi:hypothetical protein